jgi:hypothetical protein
MSAMIKTVPLMTLEIVPIVHFKKQPFDTQSEKLDLADTKSLMYLVKEKDLM